MCLLSSPCRADASIGACTPGEWFHLFHDSCPCGTSSWNHARCFVCAGLSGITMPAVPVFHVEQRGMRKADREPWLYNIVLQNIFIWNHGTKDEHTRFYAVFCVPRYVEPSGTGGTTTHGSHSRPSS